MSSQQAHMVIDADATLLDEPLVPTGRSANERWHATDDCVSLQTPNNREAPIHEIHTHNLWPCKNCHDKTWVALPTGAYRSRPRYHTEPCSGYRQLDRVKWTTLSDVREMEIEECKECQGSLSGNQEQGYRDPCPVCGSEDFVQLSSHLRNQCDGGDI